jgi:hypothetical protein
VRTDPFRALPTSARIWLASLLSLLPLGTAWSIQPGLFLPTPPIPGLCDPNTGICDPDIPTAGVLAPGSTELVSQSPARVMLVFAGAALFFVATRPRTENTRIVAQVACLSLGVAAALAAAHVATTTLLCTLTALGLVAPPAWRRARRVPSRDPAAQDGGGLAPRGRSA